VSPKYGFFLSLEDKLLILLDFVEDEKSDWGSIKIYSLYLRNNNFLDYGTFSIKLVHKFLFIILIWTSLFLIIYLCK
jgi:hypothetical protein